MGVGTSDGQTYDSELHYQQSKVAPISTTQIKDQERVASGTMAKGSEITNDKASFEDRFPIYIDRSHDVPLAASALVSKDGIAVDKDAKPTDMGIPGWDPAIGVY